MYIGPNRLQAIAYDMLGLNVIDPITVEYLKRYNEKKESRGDAKDTKPAGSKNNADSLLELRKLYIVLADHYMGTVDTDIQMLVNIRKNENQLDAATLAGIDERVQKLSRTYKQVQRLMNIIQGKGDDSKSDSDGYDTPDESVPDQKKISTQCQLRAQRERDLKGNPLVYKAWKRATPSLQDDCDDAW